jgi:aspartate-semialdehyde dehydrogenase
MSNFKNIVVIGATGLVGKEFVNLIEPEIFKKFNVLLVSNMHVGQYCPITNLKYVALTSIDFSIKSIYINCANSEQAKMINDLMTKESIMIDNSSEFRMDYRVPLIVPEINFEDIKKYNSKLISNPNCSTIILAMLLNTFIKSGNPIKRVVVSTYQAASGAGKEGLDELQTQTKEFINNQELTTSFWKQQYVYNTFVHNSPIDTNGYCQEENKLINETKKIFNQDIPISPTCIRVPILRSHCESVNIEFRDEITYEKILHLIKDDKNTLELIDNKKTTYSLHQFHLIIIIWFK